MKKIELFVPGRLCLIGGVSDLVSPYLKTNPSLSPGRAIACTIDKGIYSSIKKSEKLNYTFNDLSFSMDITREKLEEEINKKSFISYICGVILYLNENYHISSGIDITVTKMDLPLKKGLSSSAAICLTVVQAYNKLYDLHFTDEEMIRIAYEGEHLAGSKCGFLDQYTIMNNTCSNFTFLYDKVLTKPVRLKKDMFLLVVDLNSSKDTRVIMSAFNDALSFPKNELDEHLLDIIGAKNVFLVDKAISSLETGDIKQFGECLTGAQNLFDGAMDACVEFKAPTLHLLLNDMNITDLSYGGKCVGSGGDGSLLLVCKNKKNQDILKEYINTTYHMDSIPFCIQGEERELDIYQDDELKRQRNLF